MTEAIRAGYPRDGGDGPDGGAGPRLRLWPAALLVVILWSLVVLPARLVPDSMMVAFLSMFWGTILCVTAIALWWMFFSGASWRDVAIGLGAVPAAVGAVALLGHESIGAFPMLLYMAPIMATAFVVWLAATPFLAWPTRRAGLPIVILLVAAGFIAVRLDGTDGEFKATWRPRWQKTEEDVFLAELVPHRKPAEAKPDEPPLTASDADWPEFRGVKRDSSRPGAAIATDWDANPPKLLWKHRVGPGWSSFAVVGDRIFTQEQRGPDEAVVCYDAGTGEEVWSRVDKARFTEAVAGPGPRATPTFRDGKIYSQGATGVLHCLDARSGKAIWTRDIAVDSGSKVPTWGFSASPLVVSGIVTVYGGAKGKAVLAYDAATGEPLWSAGDGEISYCSTQRSVIDGVEQLLIATNEGVVSLEPKTGKELWRHDWPLQGMARVTQPQLVGDEILIGTSFDLGTRKVKVSRRGDAWETKELWTTRAIKPYYNDFVVHGDHIYGFDGAFFTCVDLKDGKRKWRERGYGSGQVLLLPDQALLVVLSETGELALVEASAAGHKELARMPALEGKTWNHPVIARDRLFVRNGQEAACYRLPPSPK